MIDAFPITIYRNPGLRAPRATRSAMIEAAGYAPMIVDYRQAG